MSGRIVANFSCGAASAVATKLAVAQYGDSHELSIVNAFVAEEHPDNRRFLADCERWFGRPITVLRDDRYEASAHVVWERRRYIKGLSGAPCSKFLKREVLDAFTTPSDTVVLGYTIEEKDRLDRWIDANNGRRAIVPLIDRDLTKADCLAMIERAGIDLPMMYRLGYNNANCIGCCKGGQGYWNKIRRDFPVTFERVAQIEERIGPSSYLFRDRGTGRRYSLRELNPASGRHDEVLPDCGVHCELAESVLGAMPT